MIPDEITNDLKQGLSLSDTLVKHNTNLKELFNSKPRARTVHATKRKRKYVYYDKGNDCFQVARTFNSRRCYFGTYASEEAAGLAVELFEKYGWNPEDNWRVKSEVKKILGDLK